jgi:serine/threonine-protein kinase
VSVAYQHVREQAAPPSSLDPDLPPEVDQIVMKALAKSTDDRYQSAAAMRADIERFLAGKPVAAPVVPVAGAAAFAPTDSPDDATSIFNGQPVPEEDRKQKRWPFVLLALGILALMVAAAVFGGRLFSSPGEQNSVPSVTSMKLKQAKARIEDAGLSVGQVDREASEDVAKGRVIAQDPDPLTLLDPGAPVDLTVSTGSPDVVVPYVVGKNRDEARQILEDAGLEVKMVKEQSDEPRDVVTRTDPEPAENVSKGSQVTVYYSAGPKEVPSVVGMTQEKATRVLKKAGFAVDVTYDSDTVAEKGQVLKQSPEAYTEQPQGTRVLLTVSSYEEPSPTPSAEPSPSETPTSPSPSPSPSESGGGPLG